MSVTVTYTNEDKSVFDKGAEWSMAKDGLVDVLSSDRVTVASINVGCVKCIELTN